jgi:hypothetical protein
LAVPPRTLAQDYTDTIRHDGSIQQVKRPQRHAFMLCQLIRALNDAAAHYKQHHCVSDDANYNKTYMWEHTKAYPAKDK